MKNDTQIIEIIGRNYLVNQLLTAGIEVAIPVRDHGVDLIAYLDIDSIVEGYAARPIQIKASSSQIFIIDKKYSRFPHLILVYIWNLKTSARTVVFGLNYEDALLVANEMGYLKTKSWENGKYVTTAPSEKLINLLHPYIMTEEKWISTLRKF